MVSLNAETQRLIEQRMKETGASSPEVKLKGTQWLCRDPRN
jgi:hypothetical protein